MADITTNLTTLATDLAAAAGTIGVAALAIFGVMVGFRVAKGAFRSGK